MLVDSGFLREGHRGTLLCRYLLIKISRNAGKAPKNHRINAAIKVANWTVFIDQHTDEGNSWPGYPLTVI